MAVTGTISRNKRGIIRRFDPSSEQERRSWYLPVSIEAYLLSNFRKYIKHATLQETTVLDQHPVPNSLAKLYPKKLDSFIKNSLSKRKKIRQAEEDRNLEKIQKRGVNIMGPLSWIWMRVNSMKESTSSKEDFDGLTQAVEQAIILVVQAAYNIKYHGRLKILNALFKDTRKATHTIKENEELLKMDGNALFRRKFERELRKKAKSRSISKDLFRTTLNQFNKQQHKNS